MKKMFLKVSQNSQEDICAGVFFNQAAGLQLLAVRTISLKWWWQLSSTSYVIEQVFAFCKFLITDLGAVYMRWYFSPRWDVSPEWGTFHPTFTWEIYPTWVRYFSSQLPCMPIFKKLYYFHCIPISISVYLFISISNN